MAGGALPIAGSLCFEVLAQEGGFRVRAGFYAVAGVIEVLFSGDGLLVGGKDEGRSLRNDFGEAGGASPTAGEGADAVDAAKVGYCSEMSGDRRSGRVVLVLGAPTAWRVEVPATLPQTRVSIALPIVVVVVAEKRLLFCDGVGVDAHGARGRTAFIFVPRRRCSRAHEGCFWDVGLGWSGGGFRRGVGWWW